MKMTKSLETRFVVMARKTWTEVKEDWLQAYGNPMSREQIIALLCSATWLQVYGGDREAYKAWVTMPSEVRMAFLRERVFRSEFYSN